MMSWENTIMTRHAETLLPTPGLRALNVGHGMGIVDTAIQAREPSQHHIIEAHPQVLLKLRENGWFDKANVTIHAGRWQDILPKLIEEGVVFDAIYYDTFAEDYPALKSFFSEYVPSLLDSNGRLGWYNALGSDRQICYDVYTKVSSGLHGLTRKLTASCRFRNGIFLTPDLIPLGKRLRCPTKSIRRVFGI